MIEEHVSENVSFSSETTKTCSFCLFEEKGSVIIHSGKQWNHINEIEIDLHHWYLKNQISLQKSPIHTSETEQDEQESYFFKQNFDGKTKKDLATHIFQHKSVPSDFDVIDYLFFGVIHPQSETTRQNSGINIINASNPNTNQVTETKTTPNNLTSFREEDILLRVLYSVILGDGKILESESRALESICNHWSQELPVSDRRIWRPTELPIPKDPEHIIQFAIKIAASDDEIDQTEWRIIEEFSRYWSIDATRLESLRKKYLIPKPNKLHRIFTVIHNLFFTESP